MKSFSNRTVSSRLKRDTSPSAAKYLSSLSGRLSLASYINAAGEHPRGPDRIIHVKIGTSGIWMLVIPYPSLAQGGDISAHFFSLASSGLISVLTAPVFMSSMALSLSMPVGSPVAGSFIISPPNGSGRASRDARVAQHILLTRTLWPSVRRSSHGLSGEDGIDKLFGRPFTRVCEHLMFPVASVDQAGPSSTWPPVPSLLRYYSGVRNIP